MRICTLLIGFFMMIHIEAQPYASTHIVKIYNAEELINKAKTKGLKEIKKEINPIDLLYIDSTYAPLLIDLEFKAGFWSNNYDNNKINTYELPELTLELAYHFNNFKASRKLYDYYCSIPKHYKSDTIYCIYNNLDDYLKVLVKFNSPRLIEKLKQDYSEWTKLAEKSPKKVYPTVEEMRKTPFEESMKFKPEDLLIDCNYMALQLAGALNYLKVEGFDNPLIENLKTKQTYPFANRYTFPKQMVINSKSDTNSSKTIPNSNGIKDFRKDYLKVETLIRDNFKNHSNLKVYEIIEKGSKAYVSVSSGSGYNFYSVILRPDNKIDIHWISGIME